MERNSSLFPIDLPSINYSVLWRLNAKKHWVRGNYHWVGGTYHWVRGPLLNLKESCETIFVPPLWIVLPPWKRTKWKKVRLVQPLNGVSATASEVNITYYLIFQTIKLCLLSGHIAIDSYASKLLLSGMFVFNVLKDFFFEKIWFFYWIIFFNIIITSQH